MNTNRRVIAALSIMLLFSLSGCGIKGDDSNKKDIAFFVCDDTKLPNELLEIINEKKMKPFRLTYALGDSLYIAIGYGEHDKKNLNIVVRDLYMTESGIYVNTELLTNQATATDSSKTGEASLYPYIVLKIDKIDLPVIFEVK